MNQQSDMPEWENPPEDINKYYGFIYLITNKLNNRKYIGKKTFWFKETKKPLKGKKRRRISKKESDWKTYWGSSKLLNEELEEYGYENFKREILCYTQNKRESAYKEAELQFKHDALFSDEYYNGTIQLRISYPVKKSIDIKEKF